MAWEAPVQDIPSAVAGADFTGVNGGTTHGYQGTGQFLLCKLSGDSTYVPCSNLFDVPVGISQTNPKSGDAIQMRVLGVSKVMVGVGGLLAGNLYGSDANGLAIAKGPTATGANLGQYVLGYVVEGAAAGALATVYVAPPYSV